MESTKLNKVSEIEQNIELKNTINGTDCRETNNDLNKRQQRQQPMVMVWNTYFPNGKMVPLRQPQPPVYFGPVIGHSNDNQPQPQVANVSQPISNNHLNHPNSPPASHQLPAQETDNTPKEFTHFSNVNGLKEDGHQSSPSTSPLFTPNQLPVVGPV